MDRYLDSARGGPLYLKLAAHRATGNGFHPLRRAPTATLRPAGIRRHGEPHAPASAATRKPQPILTNPKGLHRTRSESAARTHGPAILQADRRNLTCHSVRDDRESDRIRAYLENNPVKAGLVANAEDSSLVERGKKSRDESNLGSAGSTACATNFR
jgi:hypothetical protein